MEFSEHEKNGVIVITINGDMVGGPGARQLTEQLRSHIQSGAKNFILNMEKVHFINSSGLGILIGGLSTVREGGGNLKLLNAGKKIIDLLRITKLEGVFEVYQSEEEALAGF